MKITQIRNATVFLDYGDHKFIVDPMLGDKGSLFPFKLFGGGRRRNPLVPLPDIATECLEQATGVIVTHEHLDHFDSAGLSWILERQLPVYASPIDVQSLRSKGLNVISIENEMLDFTVEVIPSRHSHGLLNWLLGPVAGIYLARSGSPSLYLTGDSVLTEEVREAISRLQPEIVVAPAGAANFGIGSDILFSVEELLELTRIVPGRIVFNHLEALDHCPTTRVDLSNQLTKFKEKVVIPQDGETLDFAVSNSSCHEFAAKARTFRGKPGLQKWVTKFFAGT